MPNTAVKAANAESTWGEAPWEDRKPLIKLRSTSIMKCFFFCIKQRSRFKQRTRFKGPKGRINLRESLTPKQGFGVGGGVSKPLFLTDAVGDKSDEILPMWQLLRRKPKGD